jgi:hypothetical protein
MYLDRAPVCMSIARTLSEVTVMQAAGAPLRSISIRLEDQESAASTTAASGVVERPISVES